MTDMPNIFKMQEQELNALQRELDDVKRRYELYFMGTEKREPGYERDQLERKLRVTKLHRTQKTELRFRFQQFLARYRTFAQHWNRVCREIEDGTWRRGSTTPAERLAARQAEIAMQRAQGVEPDDVGSSQAGEKESERIAEAARMAAAMLASGFGGGSSKPKRATPGRPTPEPSDGAARPKRRLEGDVAELYAAYVHAKQARGDDVSKVSYSAFARSVEKQRGRAREKLGRDVSLRVKVSGDKVTLVASPGESTPRAPARSASTPPRSASAPPPPPRIPTVPPGVPSDVLVEDPTPRRKAPPKPPPPPPVTSED